MGVVCVFTCIAFASAFGLSLHYLFRSEMRIMVISICRLQREGDFRVETLEEMEGGIVGVETLVGEPLYRVLHRN